MIKAEQTKRYESKRTEKVSSGSGNYRQRRAIKREGTTERGIEQKGNKETGRETPGPDAKAFGSMNRRDIQGANTLL